MPTENPSSRPSAAWRNSTKSHQSRHVAFDASPVDQHCPQRHARSPFPLPFGSLEARRSLLAVENLLAAIETVLCSNSYFAPPAEKISISSCPAR